MTLVVDAAFVVAALVDGSSVGSWADELLGTDDLAAPHLMPAEVANILRRAALAGEISEDSASMAHEDLLDMGAALFPYGPLAERSGSSGTTSPPMMRGTLRSLRGWAGNWPRWMCGSALLRDRVVRL